MMQLLHGDCLELLKAVPDHSVDLILADLPYGITKAKWDCPIPMTELWSHYSRIASDKAAILLFASQPFTSQVITSNPKWFRYCWYWEKEKGTGFLNSKKQPLRCIEEICVFYQRNCTYNPIMVPLNKPYKHKLPTKASQLVNKVASSDQEIQYRTYTHSYPKNILKYARDKANQGVHSTQKPLALIEYLVQTYSDEGQLVLDNVMGSGTTALACRKLNRNFIGMEIDPLIFEIAKKRLGNLSV